jgi:hypothetical protein
MLRPQRPPSRSRPGSRDCVPSAAATRARLFGALLKTLDYAVANDGIGLTASKAFNRKFATWAAETLDWPEYAAAELNRVNKLLNEEDVLPVVVIHDLMAILKRGRHVKGRFRLSTKALALRDGPAALFALVARTYLFVYNHARIARGDQPSLDGWDLFLNVINVEAEVGVTEEALMRVFYGVTPRRDVYDRDYHDLAGALFVQVLRPLHWLGLLDETKVSRSTSSHPASMR